MELKHTMPSARAACLSSEGFQETLRPLVQAHPVAQRSKRIHLQCRRRRGRRFDPWVGKIPWRKKCKTPNILAWKNLSDREAWQQQSTGSEKSQIRLSTAHSTFPRPGLEQVPSAVKVQSPNQWTAGELPVGYCLRQWPGLCCLSRDSE